MYLQLVVTFHVIYTLLHIITHPRQQRLSPSDCPILGPQYCVAMGCAEDVGSGEGTNETESTSSVNDDESTKFYKYNIERG